MSFSTDLRNLDLALALSRMGGDVGLLQEIARLFLDDYPHLVAEIRDAITAGDARLLERGAHTLKGSVSNFGAARAVEAALALEKIGRSGDLEQAGAAMAELERVLSELEPELVAVSTGPEPE